MAGRVTHASLDAVAMPTGAAARVTHASLDAVKMETAARARVTHASLDVLILPGVAPPFSRACILTAAPGGRPKDGRIRPRLKGRF